ncbi:hypothetical protein SAMN05444287_1792 [Octadecabacter temperatus]|uniref:Uncharacterized protein n=1 Tax=Octadecabacter temperatus TaxID=1458307 RepID=A0A0K0Y6T2_9RHOB|nr:DUF1513 domain-containing protein [Octadecabacter temperatus]AKS46674.1 hypothetical protein OSB_21350 [Octadecabacter temperatus]SIO19062.1 hypothetical protein SAMN05444287_1792 [Octadecabacter temperatus]
MATRRGFLAGLIASGIAPAATWADAGNPSFLSAARTPDGAYVLVGLDGQGAERFRIPLPTRGHAAAAHPTRPHAVAFARRPGTYAVVLDCQSGDVIARLNSPSGRHFYGHGTFDATGDLLFTTENDYELGQGRIGVWDARHGYVRVTEMPSNGVGPHDLRLMPDGTLVVANGGIDTHPASGREKLNIPTMRPNLSYLEFDGRLIEQIEPDDHLASIRHLSVRADGLVAVGMQWQGDMATSPPLVATHSRNGPMQYMGDGVEVEGYVGSVAFSGDGSRVAITSPRAGEAQIFEAASGAILERMSNRDVCGVSALGRDMVLTNGAGQVYQLAGDASLLSSHDLSWDNHLVAVGNV